MICVHQTLTDDRLSHNVALYPCVKLLHCTDTETLYVHFVNTVLTISWLNMYRVKILFLDAGTCTLE